ncbi:hypothetical protein J2797_006557 [Paraburkholderia terricola]|uniref:GIY-YIG nuclease family protein n=1 Tax=Paraburkholderia terricola TaxID=169427 RepID=UPI000DEFA618|nr:GIY-YIG nuclease family protein [Paraburkholderia terricola]AXE96284.1 hypothetical protein CUJ90_29260 [Paraburkholderia terricola]MDR6496630.1 hypothetical protein [Paraburkholderia terricola]
MLAIGSAGLASNARCRTHRSRLERSLHDLFARASLDIEIKDRFGKPIRPREWFLLPLSIIGQAVPMIVDGSILGSHSAPRTHLRRGHIRRLGEHGDLGVACGCQCG